MSDLYYLVSSQFEAASQITSLPKSHPASRLHGHSYQVSLRIKDDNQAPLDINQESQHLNDIVKQVNYSFLNDHIDNPTDENIARWFLAQKIHLTICFLYIFYNHFLVSVVHILMNY